ncbi:MAG: hypothetical protein AAF125_24505, partial [Chloroflexota bacterium]
MAKRIKITTFMDDAVGREEAEKKLEWLVNDGWEIVTSGGGSHAQTSIWGFIILQKEDPNYEPEPYDV